ncbi:N-acetylneuraminate synthase family protein [Azospirillum brasilense]|nr:N-acetylneuraminate synthase family protein [Azospirillum brasilense]
MSFTFTTVDRMRIGTHDLNERVLVIAEIGNNHEGDFTRAQEMIVRAAEAGADAVKFQTIVPDRLVSATDTARIEQLTRFRFDYDQFARLAETAERAGVIFLSTPFDLESAAALAPLVPAFKVASGDNDFFALLAVVARMGKPVLLSTGMLDLAGVQRAAEHIAAQRPTERPAEKPQAGLVLLHCVAAYPAPVEDANLGALRSMASLGHPVGYSDHTLGIEAAVLSVALGARVIEKHFTLDKTLSTFRDHALSADPSDMAELVRRVREAETLLGDGIKRPATSELANMTAARRAIAAVRDLPAGHVLALEDLTWLRPRRGLEPGRESELIGCRLAVPVARGEAFTLDHMAEG